MGFIAPVATNSDGTERVTGRLQALGKDDFLQLLVTKMQYQDPLNPLEDSDFIAQLAQFSSLEQMNNIADGIETSNDLDFLQSQSINNTMAAGLIGKDVKATYRGVYLEKDSDPTINYTTSKYAQEIEFTITDLSGATVATVTMEDVQAGVNQFTWDGKDSRGNRVDEGYYYVEAVATDADGNQFDPSLSLVGKVESISYREGTAFLRVNGTEVPLGDITAVGEPGAYTDSTETDGPDSPEDDG